MKAKEIISALANYVTWTPLDNGVRIEGDLPDWLGFEIENTYESEREYDVDFEVDYIDR